MKTRTLKNISDVWLGGDHYKWRAMRSLGVPEEEITGKNADKLNKFVKWLKLFSMLLAIHFTTGLTLNFRDTSVFTNL